MNAFTQSTVSFLKSCLSLWILPISTSCGGCFLRKYAMQSFGLVRTVALANKPKEPFLAGSLVGRDFVDSDVLSSDLDRWWDPGLSDFCFLVGDPSASPLLKVNVRLLGRAFFELSSFKAGSGFPSLHREWPSSVLALFPVLGLLLWTARLFTVDVDPDPFLSCLMKSALILVSRDLILSLVF